MKDKGENVFWVINHSSPLGGGLGEGNGNTYPYFGSSFSLCTPHTTSNAPAHLRTTFPSHKMP